MATLSLSVNALTITLVTTRVDMDFPVQCWAISITNAEKSMLRLKWKIFLAREVLGYFQVISHPCWFQPSVKKEAISIYFPMIAQAVQITQLGNSPA